jgi:hypothetical protein
MNERCLMSDLPSDQCAHCPGATSFSVIHIDPLVPPDQDTDLATTATDILRRNLPVLSNISEYGQPDVHDMVNELTRDHGHRQRYTVSDKGTIWNRAHITDVPALVNQLLGATPGGSKDEAGAGAAKSKPAARIEAIDTLMLIDDEAARWIRRLGHDDPGDKLDPTTKRPISGSGTIACIQLLHGLHASTETCGRTTPTKSPGGRPTCCTRHTIEHDIRRWWQQARIITGWDTASYRPFNTCPVCEHRGGLRINVVIQAGFCVECRSVWSADDIGLLAEHIRAENGEDADVTRPREPWPSPWSWRRGRTRRRLQGGPR